MVRTCKYCGKEFDAKGTAQYCKGPHFATCAVCGGKFEVNPKEPRNTCSAKCRSQLRASKIAMKPRICELCGKTFYATGNTARYCSDDHFRPCPVCGTPVKIINPYDPPHGCSPKCTTILRQRTCEATYGVKVASQAESVRQKLHDKAVDPKVVKQRQQTSIANWGVDNPAKHPDVQAKISDTVASEECQTQTKATNQAKYGADHIMQTQEGKDKFRKNRMS